MNLAVPIMLGLGVVTMVLALTFGSRHSVMRWAGQQTPPTDKILLRQSPLSPPEAPSSAAVAPSIDLPPIWPTYTDPLHRFSLRYPPSWFVYRLKDYPYEGYPGVIDESRIIVTSHSPFPRISAGDVPSDPYVGIDVYQTKMEAYATTPPAETSVERTSIAGNEAYRLTNVEFGEVSLYIPYNTNSGGLFIEIHNPGRAAQDNSLINETLNTLRLLR